MTDNFDIQEWRMNIQKQDMTQETPKQPKVNTKLLEDKIYNQLSKKLKVKK